MKTVTTDNKTFTAHQMTITEVRAWADGVMNPGYQCNIVDELAAPGISLGDLALIYHCEIKDFDDLTCRELDLLVEAARETNAHYFRLRVALAQTAEAIMGNQIPLLNVCGVN